MVSDPNPPDKNRHLNRACFIQMTPAQLEAVREIKEIATHFHGIRDNPDTDAAVLTLLMRGALEKLLPEMLRMAREVRATGRLRRDKTNGGV